jgi:hypothetical protein
MNHIVAYQLLDTGLLPFRELSYAELRQLVGEKSTNRVRGEDGMDYDLATIVQWRTGQSGDICVTGFVAESAWGGPHDSINVQFIVPERRGEQD